MLYMKSKSMEKVCEGCTEVFTVDRETIHCLKCDRWYCTKCWTEYDDENWPTDVGTDYDDKNWLCTEKSRFWECERGAYGEFEVPAKKGCDECRYDIPKGTAE